MMKFGGELFFTKGFNSPGIFVGSSWDLPDIIYKMLFIIFCIVLVIIFGIFRAKMMKCGREIFFIKGMYNSLGILAGPFLAFIDSLHALILIIWRLLVLICCGFFRTKMIKL